MARFQTQWGLVSDVASIFRGTATVGFRTATAFCILIGSFGSTVRRAVVVWANSRLPLPNGHAAIGDDQLAGDGARGVADQKRDCVGDLIRLQEAVHRNLGFPDLE